MDYLVHKLTLDMHKTVSQAFLSVKKGDTKRKLYITLTEKGKVFLVNGVSTAVFVAKKHNGDVLFNDCTIEKGVIVYEFTDHTTEISGKMDCEIRLYDEDGTLISSPQFTIIVDGVVDVDGTVVASNEFSALAKLMSSATEMVNATGEYAEAAKASADEADASNQVAKKAATEAEAQAQASASSAERAETSASSVEESKSTVYGYMGRAETAAVSAENSAASASESARFAESTYAGVREQLDENTDDIEQMKKDIADLKYVPIDITHISNSVGVVEMGRTVNGVILSWTTNKTPVSLTVDGESVDAAAESIQLDTSITANKTFTVIATDERGATASATTSITFHNGVYYGVGTPTTNILTLNKKLQSGKDLTFTVDAGDGQNILFALPTRYGTPNFNVGGFDGGFHKINPINFTNASGYTESYDVWVSDNTGLGNTTVKVS